ncbi:MAG: hydroxymethylglutaryl-CoA reductase, degradative [Promethearchaeota archaeon]
MKEICSDISGFYKLSLEERQKKLIKIFNFNQKEIKLIENFGYFSSSQINNLIENVFASFQLPLGIACNFKINGKDYLIPMVTEEPSVIAAASNAAKIARKHGGFHSYDVKSIMIGQIQLIDFKDNIEVVEKVLDNKEEIIKIANEKDPKLVSLGGGAFDIQIRALPTRKANMIILHLLVDVKDAMGANAVNTMVESISPFIEDICQCKVLLRIVSNLSIYRIAKSEAIFDKDLLGGSDAVNGIMSAYDFALADPFRAATHNKGILNGIIALAIATGNDTRAIEAGAHAYAALKEVYSPLTSFEIDENGNLKGKIEIPLSLGIVGGMTKEHPMVQLVLKILNVKSANELCKVAAALGLAQNVAALRALATEGIQKGHMKLHARKFKKE